MDLIRIQCETCRAWLKVRGEGFVGEVHACPRCGSMVLIAAPRNESETRADPATPGPPPTLGLSQTLETVEVPTEQLDYPTEDSRVDADSIEPNETSELPVATSIAWAPIATTAVSLMATAALVTLWLVSGSTTPADDPVAVAELETQDEQVVEPVEPTPPPINDEPSSEDAEPDEPASEPDVFPDSAVESIATELPPEPATEEPQTPEASESPSAAPSPPAEPVEPTSKVIDPLSLDPSEVELVLRRGAAAERESPETKSTSSSDQPTDAETDATVSLKPPTLDDRLAEAQQRAGVYFRRGPTDATTGPPATAAEVGLARVVPSIELTEIPLVETLRLLGDLAGVPITLDPAALRRAGVASTKRIDLAAEGETVGELLRTALGKLRLDYQTDGPQIVVVRKGAEEQREITHKLADLAGSEPSELAELLTGLLDADDPFEISTEGKLRLNAPLGLHYDLLVLCERLRVARGLPTQTKYPRELLDVDFSSAGLAALERRTTFAFTEPTPLATIFEHWQRVIGRPVLVDWRALGEAGYGPQTTIVCSVTNRDWDDVFETVLGSLDLTWTLAFDDSIVISSHVALAAERTIEFYPIAPKLVDHPDVRGLVVDDRQSDLTAERGTIGIYDEQSRCLLLRNSPAAQFFANDAVNAAKQSDLE